MNGMGGGMVHVGWLGERMEGVGDGEGLDVWTLHWCVVRVRVHRVGALMCPHFRMSKDR